jgi:serine/threonine protein kinase
MIGVLGDRYEINQQLSRKAGRQTLLALDRETGEQVVVKLLTFNSEFEWEALKLFERETQVLKTLSHSSIPKYLNSFELDEPGSKGFALVQTYIEAPSLESYIKSRRTFSEIEIKQVTKSLLETLIYLHSQHPPVIHRDIKPSNILLANRSGNYVGQVYLVDFGSVQTGASRNSGTFTVVGTYGYMPPEQFSGRTTPVSDLYSLGATLIYIATGQHPADLMTDDLQLEFGQSIMLSSELTRWLRRIVQIAPSKRFANAREALQALKNPYPHEDLALPVARPVGCRITLDKQYNQLCIQLPHAYLGSSDQLSQFWEIGVGVVGLVLFVMIFTASPWHIVSFVLFIYLCDAISKVCSYKILINDEKISFQVLLMSFKLKTWSYRKEDIYRLDFGKLPLKGWAQTRLPVEHQHHQVILNIGAKSYVIHTQSEIEISWLAHELSGRLNLPLTPLTAHETTNKSIASQQITQPSQILQPPTQRTIDRVSLPVGKPANSKIQLTKQNGNLRIHLPRQTSGIIVVVQVFIAIFSFGAYFLLLFLAWVSFWYFGWMEGSELREVLINQSCIRFRYKLYGLTIVRSYPRQQISRLHVVDGYQRTAPEGSTIQHPNQIIVWLGALFIPITIPTDVEMIWLSQELSEWLNVPITQRPLIKS